MNNFFFSFFKSGGSFEPPGVAPGPPLTRGNHCDAIMQVETQLYAMNDECNYYTQKFRKNYIYHGKTFNFWVKLSTFTFLCYFAYNNPIALLQIATAKNGCGHGFIESL